MTEYCSLISCLVLAGVVAETQADIIVDFEEAQVGQLVESWTEEGVVFTSTAPGGLLSFNTHSTGHMGMFEALADIEAPIHAGLPVLATSVTVVFWGSDFQVITLQAFSSNGAQVDELIMGVPDAGIGQPAILFEMTVSAPNIAAIQFTGSTTAGFISADEVRITPIPSPAAALIFIGLLHRSRRRTNQNG